MKEEEKEHFERHRGSNLRSLNIKEACYAYSTWAIESLTSRLTTGLFLNISQADIAMPQQSKTTPID